jgi:hypothetical protein
MVDAHCEHCEAFCVCKTCTCGKHKCPPQRDESIPFDGETTYHTHFPRREHIPSAPRKKAPKPWQSGERGEYASEYTDKYVPKKARATERSAVLNTYQPTTDNRDWRTAHYDDYIKWESVRAKPIRPKHERLQNRPFDGSTEYTRSYVPKKANYKRTERPVADRPPPSAFNGETTYLTQYKKWAIVQTTPIKPKNVRGEHIDAREFVTESRHEFVPKQSLPCPIAVVMTKSGCAPVVKENGHTYYVKDGQPRRPKSARTQWSKPPRRRINRPYSAASGGYVHTAGWRI